MNAGIAGVDEVGRGSLFGPVFAGAVILSESSQTQLIAKGLTDSKKLSSKKRSELAILIKEISDSWSVGQASNNEIDQIGIRKATEKAMLRAIQKIKIPINLLLIDGIFPIRNWAGEQITVIKGDQVYPSISAASVIAKVERDQLIKRLSEKFNGYGLESHMGYGTKLHRESILRLGKTVLHRKTFLRKLLSQLD